jgi:hypothetical protein
MVVYPDGKLDTFQSIQYVGLNKSLTDFNQVVTYPNPSNGRITVQLNSSIASPVNLMVYDLSGKLCAQQIMQAQSGSNLMDWNLSDLSEGAYLLRIQSAESVTTQKLIIAK